MTTSSVSICLLFPDLLGTYGDGGNAMVLAKRLLWRNIDVEIVTVDMGSSVPEGCNVYLLGGGEDQPQSSVTKCLSDSGALNRAVDSGAAVLAVCAGMQVIGRTYEIGDGTKRDGLGLLDIETVRTDRPRCVGELVAMPDPEVGNDALSGYENHGGATLLGPGAKALGTVTAGRGNDDGHKTEGAIAGHVVGTYLHGPALARNPQLADLLLRWATGGEKLDEIDDSPVRELRAERLRAATTSVAESFVDRFRGSVSRRIRGPYPVQ